MDDIPTYKIILLGEVGVGKTSLFTRITTGKFCDDHSSFTRSLDYYQYDTRVGKDRIKVALWDTAGFERFQSGSPLYSHYRRATGALLVYSVEDSHTFDKLQGWVTEATYFVDPLFKWALIGNKCDLPRKVERTRVRARCEQLQITLSYSVSAKTGHNVMKAFNDLVAAIHVDNKQQHIYNGYIDSSVQLNSSINSEPTSKRCCS